MYNRIIRSMLQYQQSLKIVLTSVAFQNQLGWISMHYIFAIA